MSLTTSVVLFSNLLATTFFNMHKRLKNNDWGITDVFYV